jgi:hypothetical protein
MLDNTIHTEPFSRIRISPDTHITFDSIKPLMQYCCIKKFCGPGLYLKNEETILIICADKDNYIKETPSRMYFWSSDVEDDAKYHVFVYKCNVDYTLFSCFIPIRIDTRTV